MTMLDDRPATKSFAAALVFRLRGRDINGLVELSAGYHIRHVRTAEGAKLFDQPIGAIITKDMLHPLVKSLAQLNEFPAGTKIVHDKGKGKEVIYTKKVGGYWESSATKKYGVSGALQPLIVTGQLHVRDLPGEDLEGLHNENLPPDAAAVAGDATKTPTVGKASPKVTDASPTKIGFNPGLHDAANKKRDPDLVAMSDEDLGKAIKKTEENLLKAKEKVKAGEQTYGAEKNFAAKLDKLRGEEQFRKTDQQYNSGAHTGGKQAAPAAAPAAPAPTPTPASAAAPAPPSKAPDAAQAPSAPAPVPAPQGAKVADVAGLDAMPTGAKISYTTTSGDVRSYVKESDGRWSGPSGYHDATDFSQGAKEGRVITVPAATPEPAPSAPEPTPQAPAAPQVQEPPAADVKTLKDITDTAQANTAANVNNFEKNKQKLNDYPVGTKVQIGKATYEKKTMVSKGTGQSTDYWGNANGAYGAYAAGTLATSPHEVVTDQANEPDPESYFAASPETAGQISQPGDTNAHADDARWQLGTLTSAGTTGKGKKALADALTAASKKTTNKNDGAALATAAGVLTSPNWATYGGPEKHGAQLTELGPNVLTTAGLTQADIDARVKAVADLAKYLDEKSQGTPLGMIQVASVTGKESPSVSEYLKRFAQGYKDAKSKKREAHKAHAEAEAEKAKVVAEKVKADEKAATEKARADAKKAKADEQAVMDKLMAVQQAGADKQAAAEAASKAAIDEEVAKQAAIKELNSQTPEDKSFISKPSDQPYTPAEIMNAPIGSKVSVKSKSSDASANYTKTDSTDYWKYDDGNVHVHMPSEAEAGLAFNVDRAKKEDVPNLNVDAKGKKLFTSGGKSVYLAPGDVPYVSDSFGYPGNVYVHHTNDGGEWTIHMENGFENEMGQSSLLDKQLTDNKFKLLSENGPVPNAPSTPEPVAAPHVDAPGLKAPEPALKITQFTVQGTPFTAPPGTKLYGSKLSDDLPDVIAVHPDGEMYLHGTVNGHVTSLKQDATSVKILQGLIDKGQFVDKTNELATPDKLHPSGLKPGKYSKGPSAKVYMIVNADGTAMYVDKAGHAKVLGTKGVLGNHAGGMQYHSEFTGTLPIPGTGAVTGNLTYKSNGNTQDFTVPADAKVYHVASKTPDTALTKYVQYSDGTWGKVNSQTGGKVEPVPVDLVPDLAGPTNEVGLIEDKSGVKAATAKAAAPKKTGPSFTADETGFVPNPFSAPPTFGYKTSELSAEIARLVDESGFKGVAGLNRGGMSKDQKKQWLTAWYAGDVGAAYDIELAATVKKDENTKLKSGQELIDAPLGTKVVVVQYNDPIIFTKVGEDEWGREGSTYTQTSASLAYKVDGYSSSVHYLSKAVHTKAAKHPGSPEYPGNADGVKKIKFGAIVAGELPAGVRPKGGEGSGMTADLSEFSGGYEKFTPEQVDAYMLAAGMTNAQGLKVYEKAQWVGNHYKGNKPSVDLLSTRAKNNVDKGIYYSEELTPPAPVIPAGEAVPDFTPEKPFTAEASHANNLSEFEVKSYLGPLFTKKAGAAIKAQPLDVQRAIAQLHWLSTQSPTKGAHKSPAEAKQEFTDLAKSVEEQMAPKVASYHGTLDYSIALPAFEAKVVWKKAPQEEQPNYKGAFQKFDIKDDSGNVLFFKPGKSDWRVRIADAANKMGTLFGFKTPASQLLEVDGTLGQAQKKVPNSGSTKGQRPEDLTEKQLMDLFREHVLDWTIDQDDAHDDQFLMTPDGGLVGIDKDRAFASQTTGHTGNKLERGKLSTNPNVVEKSYYEDLYKSAVTGKISPEILQKAYKQVMARAKSMQNVSDDKYRALLEHAFNDNPKMSDAQREKHIQTALDRKNSLVADFEKFWTDLLKDAGVEKPDPSKISESPGLHAGFTPELIEDVKKARNWGHATFFASSHLEDGHLLLWEQKGYGGGPEILNGQGLLLKAGDDKFAEWLQQNYTGPNTVGSPVNDDKTLQGLDAYTTSVKTGIITIAKHLQDGQYNQGSIDSMLNTKKQLQDKLDLGFAADKWPNEPKKAAAFTEMAAQYIKNIDDALAAKDNGVKPAQFAPYDYVWQPEDKDPGGVEAQIILAPQFKVTKREGSLNKAKLDPKTNILTSLDGTDTTGQSGYDYVIDFSDGSQVVYRPWGHGTHKSQQGQLRFTVPGYGDNPAQGDKIMNFLRDEVGIEAGDATDESMELQYWRTYYGTMSKRSDFNSGKQAKVKQAVEDSDPRKLADPGEELNRWREIMAEMSTPDQIVKFVEDKGFMPQFGKTTLTDPNGVHGRPHFNRFDVDLDKIRLESQFLARSVAGLGGGNYPAADDKIFTTLRSGGVAPAEERVRLLGFWKEGVSGSSDSSYGSGSFTMIRQNIESSDYHIYFDPAAMARLSSYAYDGDKFGNIEYKNSNAHWDIKQQTKHSGSSNEGVIKGGLSILSDGMLVVFSSPTKRQMAIDEYSALGLTEVNGTPLEEFFVLRQDRAKALKNAHERLKARVLGSGYTPNLTPVTGAGASTAKLSPVGSWATLGDIKNAPVGSKFTNSQTNKTKFWTKTGPDSWEVSFSYGGSTTTEDSTSIENLASFPDTIAVESYGPGAPAPALMNDSTIVGTYLTPDKATEDKIKNAPIGAKFTWESSYGSKSEYTKTGPNSWANQDGEEYGSNYSIIDNKMESGAQWTAWPVLSAADDSSMIGKNPTPDTVLNAPVGAKLQGVHDQSYFYEKIGEDLWKNHNNKTGNGAKIAGSPPEKFAGFTWVAWPQTAPAPGAEPTPQSANDPVTNIGLKWVPKGTKVITGTGAILTKNSDAGSSIYTSDKTNKDVDVTSLMLDDAEDLTDWKWESSSPNTVGKQTVAPTKQTLDAYPTGTLLTYSVPNGNTLTYTKLEDGTWQRSDWVTDGSNVVVNVLSGTGTTWSVDHPAASTTGSNAMIGTEPNSYAELGDAPVGTVLNPKTGSTKFEKQANGKWKSQGSGSEFDGADLKLNNLTYETIPAAPTEATPAKVGDAVQSKADADAQPPGTEISVQTSYGSSSIYKSEDGDWYHSDDEDHAPVDSEDWDHLLDNADLTYSKIGVSKTSGQPDALDKKYNTSNGYIPSTGATSVAESLGIGSKMTYTNGDEVIEYEKQDNGEWKVIDASNPHLMNSTYTFDSSGFQGIHTIKVTYDSNAPFQSLFASDPNAMANADSGKAKDGSVLLHSSDELDGLPSGAKIKTTGEAVFTKQPDGTWKDMTGWLYKASDFSLAISGNSSYWKLPESQWDAPSEPAAVPVTLKHTNDLSVMPEGAKVKVTYSGETTTYTKMPNGNWFGTGTGLTGISSNDVLFKDAFSDGGTVVTVPAEAKHKSGPVGSTQALEDAPVGTRIKKTYGDGTARTFLKIASGKWKKEDTDDAEYESDSAVFSGKTLNSLEWTTEPISKDAGLGAGFTNADYDFVKIMAGAR